MAPGRGWASEAHRKIGPGSSGSAQGSAARWTEVQAVSVACHRLEQIGLTGIGFELLTQVKDDVPQALLGLAVRIWPQDRLDQLSVAARHRATTAVPARLGQVPDQGMLLAGEGDLDAPGAAAAEQSGLG